MQKEVPLPVFFPLSQALAQWGRVARSDGVGATVAMHMRSCLCWLINYSRGLGKSSGRCVRRIPSYW